MTVLRNQKEENLFLKRAIKNMTQKLT